MDEDINQNNSERLDHNIADDWKQEAHHLLKQSRIAFLASLGEHGPEATMAPFAIHEGNILLHLSALAKHTGNIKREPNIGIMICTPETTEGSPLALPRLSIQGTISAVEREEISTAKLAYLKNIPEAEQLFTFADFRLFQFSPTSIHWVGGFGKARKLSLPQWQAMT